MAKAARPPLTSVNAAGSRRRTARVPQRPGLAHERALWQAGHRIVAGVDEVGRGAWAGPLSVGVAVLCECPPRVPRGLRDSKQLTEDAREAMFERVAAWCAAWAVGHAGPEECDRVGMTAALRLATRRALVQLPAQLVPDAVVLDGVFDFVSPPAAPTLFDLDAGSDDADDPVHAEAASAWPSERVPPVHHGGERGCALRVGGGSVGVGQGDPRPHHAGGVRDSYPPSTSNATRVPVPGAPAGAVWLRAERRAPALVGVRRQPPVGAHHVARRLPDPRLTP